MYKFLKRADCDTGASLVEYSLLVALISIISIAGVDTFGDTTADKIVTIADEVTKAGVANNQPLCVRGPFDPPC